MYAKNCAQSLAQAFDEYKLHVIKGEGEKSNQNDLYFVKVINASYYKFIIILSLKGTV